MDKLTNSNLYKINGGAINLGLALSIIAGISFIIGFIDGIVNKTPCKIDETK